MKKLLLLFVFLFFVSTAFVSCRETPEEETVEEAAEGVEEAADDIEDEY